VLADDEYRVVVDEESLDFRLLQRISLSAAVDEFNDMLRQLVRARQVALLGPAYSVECWEGLQLADVRSIPSNVLDRDARLLFAELLDRCQHIEPAETDIPDPVSIDGEMRDNRSWGIAHALARAVGGVASSCLRMPTGGWPSGWTQVRHGDGNIHIHFMDSEMEKLRFWRGVFAHEKITDEAFFQLCAYAFPQLVFAESLRLGSFTAGRVEILSWLVRLFSAVNDNFANALHRHSGSPDPIMREFAAADVTISPESPNTHRNKQAWAQRLVVFGGVQHRCEWHGKRQRGYPDRVHFSLPNAEGKILVGIFTSHLSL
jgi:hypothetical protein